MSNPSTRTPLNTPLEKRSSLYVMNSNSNCNTSEQVSGSSSSYNSPSSHTSMPPRFVVDNQGHMHALISSEQAAESNTTANSPFSLHIFLQQHTPSSPPDSQARLNALLQKLNTLCPDITQLEGILALLESTVPKLTRSTPGWFRYQTPRKRDNELFRTLEREIPANASTASLTQIKEWEKQLESVRLGTLSAVELDVDNGWENSERSKLVEDAAGIFGGWSWDEAKGKPGPGLDDDVDPGDASKPNPEKQVEEGEPKPWEAFDPDAHLYRGSRR